MPDFKVKISAVAELKAKVGTAQTATNNAVVRLSDSGSFFSQLAGKYLITMEERSAADVVILKTMKAGLDNMSTQVTAAHSEASGTLKSSRDAVLSVVGASASNADLVALMAAPVVSSTCSTAESSCSACQTKASSLSSQAGGIEHGEDASAKLNDFSTTLSNQKTKITDLSTAWTSYKSAVDAFEGTYSAAFKMEAIIPDTVIAEAVESTKRTWGNSHWENFQGIAAMAKRANNMSKLIDESVKIVAGATKFVKPYTKGMSVGSFLKAHWAGIGEEAGKYVDDFARIGRFGKGVKDTAVNIAKNKPTTSMPKLSGAADKVDDVVAVSGKMRNVGRSIGVIGDVISVIDIGVKTHNAADGDKLNTFARETTKFAAGKAVGFAVGAALGGPVGAIAGVAIGIGISWAIDKIWK